MNHYSRKKFILSMLATSSIGLINHSLTVQATDVLTDNDLMMEESVIADPNTALQTSYAVKAGESLGIIARKFNTTIEELMRLNHLSSQLIHPNQILIVQNSSVSDPAPSLPKEETPIREEVILSTSEYRVKAGESLGIISRKFKTTIAELKRLNGLSSDLIHPNQILIVPDTEENPVPEPQPLPDPQPETPQTDKYVVKAGESLGIIAGKFKTTIADLKRLNGLKSELIHPNQILVVPKTQATPKPEPKPTTPPQTDLYVVKAGESLGIIAGKFKTTIADLKRLNGLSSDLIHPNQILVVPKTQAAPQPEPKPTTPPQTDLYVVKAGESLGIIAGKFKTTITELKRLNGLTSDLIHPNQILVVPKIQAVPEPEPQPTTPPQTDLYVVKAGESLGIIAGKFKTTITELKRLNGLSSDLIHPNQILVVPKTQAVPVPTPQPTTPPQTDLYVVKAGESLGIIAGKFKTTITELKRLNGLTSDLIHPNQILVVPKTQAAPEPQPIDVTKNYYLNLDTAISAAKRYFNEKVHKQWYVDWTSKGYKIRFDYK